MRGNDRGKFDELCDFSASVVLARSNNTLPTEAADGQD